eukprot:6189721-Pleurochrysis_carterae.AAC.1
MGIRLNCCALLQFTRCFVLLLRCSVERSVDKADLAARRIQSTAAARPAHTSSARARATGLSSDAQQQ